MGVQFFSWQQNEWNEVFPGLRIYNTNRSPTGLGYRATRPEKALAEFSWLLNLTKEAIPGCLETRDWCSLNWTGSKSTVISIFPVRNAVLTVDKFQWNKDRTQSPATLPTPRWPYRSRERTGIWTVRVPKVGLNWPSSISAAADGRTTCWSLREAPRVSTVNCSSWSRTSTTTA